MPYGPWPSVSSFQANTTFTHGACCNEVDLLENNSLFQDMNSLACNISGVYLSTLIDECGQDTGVCDEGDAAGTITYITNVTDFYSPAWKYTIDMQQKFIVITQFITDDGTSSGDLIEIRRLYVQSGRVIRNDAITVDGITTNVMDYEYCNVTVS